MNIDLACSLDNKHWNTESSGWLCNYVLFATFYTLPNLLSYRFLFCSGHSVAEVVWNWRWLQYHGDGTAWTKPRGSLQFLCTQVQLENSLNVGRSDGNLFTYIILNFFYISRICYMCNNLYFSTSIINKRVELVVTFYVFFWVFLVRNSSLIVLACR